MAGGVRLVMVTKAWLQRAVPPEMSPRFHPDKCDHKVIKRYGDARRFARCQSCLRKWKWNNKKEDWETWSSQGGGYLASSSRQLPLPKPSSKATASAGSSSNIFDLDFNPFRLNELRDGLTIHTDHLTEDESVELFKILEQRSPLEAEPTTVRVCLPERGALPTSPREVGACSGLQAPRAPGGAGRVEGGGRRDHGASSTRL